jgi:hypothetical protein
MNKVFNNKKSTCNCPGLQERAQQRKALKREAYLEWLTEHTQNMSDASLEQWNVHTHQVSRKERGSHKKNLRNTFSYRWRKELHPTTLLFFKGELIEQRDVHLASERIWKLY